MAMSTEEYSVTSKRAETPVLSLDQLRQLDRYGRAANYLTIGQIHLHKNSLLRELLRAEHIKPSAGHGRPLFQKPKLRVRSGRPQPDETLSSVHRGAAASCLP